MDSLNATSSPASGSGAWPCADLDGPTTAPSGPAPALASLSARQAKALGLLTSGTSGQPSTTSSASAGLQQSLASRLRALTACSGSTLYALTWKDRAGPSGRPICALRASVRRTSGNDSTGWPTPRAEGDAKNSQTHKGGNLGLPGAAALTGWPTPMAGTPAQNGNNAAGNNDSSRKTVWLAGWPTPVVSDSHKGPHHAADPGIKGTDMTTIAHWCGPARLTATGELLTGSPAGMESGGQLSPAHSRWLMGLPPEWDDCAPTATRSSRSARKRSSPPTSTNPLPEDIA